jgi:hypothetical protein
MTGLLEDYANDPEALEHVERMKDQLKEYFEKYYQHLALPSSTPMPLRVSTSDTGSPQKVDFTARYHRINHIVDELAEYLRLPREDFKTCNPIKWWAARVSQFPNLSRLARDILSIPGSAVAVERVFSGGRDTIGLRRAHLSAPTIRCLMLLKHNLRLKREAAIAELKELTS